MSSGVAQVVGSEGMGSLREIADFANVSRVAVGAVNFPQAGLICARVLAIVCAALCRSMRFAEREGVDDAPWTVRVTSSRAVVRSDEASKDAVESRPRQG